MKHLHSARRDGGMVLVGTALRMLAGSLAVIPVVASPSASLAQCTPAWDTTFTSPATGTIHASLMHTDGTGTALYLAGPATVNGSKVTGIAKSYDGKRWYALDGGLSAANGIGAVHAMKSLDMGGPNPVLVVGGQFNSTKPGNSQTGVGISVDNVAIWDGAAWSPMGAGLAIGGFNYGVSDLEFFDSGSGPKLYACGDFAVPGVPGSIGLAMWDGVAWVDVGGSGIAANFWVRDMAVFDDGTGSALYVAGAFPTLTGSTGTTANIGRWNGIAWTDVGGGLWDGERIDRIIPFAGKLWAMQGNKINAWNGTAWEGDLFVPNFAGRVTNGEVVFDDGAGPALYFGASGPSGARLIRFDGAAFTEVGDSFLNPVDGVITDFLGVHSIGGTLTLFAQTNSGTVAAPWNFLEWTAGNWRPFGGQPGGMEQTLDHVLAGLNAYSADATAFDLDGSGAQPAATIVSGRFDAIGGVQLNGLGSFNGATWSPIAAGVAGAVAYGQLLTRNESGADNLYVVAQGPATGGLGTTDSGVYRLNGGAWASIGASFGFRMYDAANSVYTDPAISGLVSGNLGNGEQLFAFGRFSEINGSPVDRVAAWDGTSWVQVGALSAANTLPATSGVIFDDGSGPALFVSGGFSGQVAKWNGSVMTTVNAGLLAGTPVLFVLNGQLWATAPTWTSGSTLSGKGLKFYRWDGSMSSWSLQATSPATSLGGLKTSSLFPIGVATTNGVSKFYIANFHVQKSPGADLVGFDGAAFSSEADMGLFNTNPSFVRGVTTGWTTAVWFGGVNAVGGASTTFTGMSAISSGGMARWFCTAPCTADFNQTGSVTVQDIFDFLAAWFAGNPAADINHAAGITVQDIFDFLAAWFGGC